MQVKFQLSSFKTVGGDRGDRRTDLPKVCKSKFFEIYGPEEEK